MQKFLDYCADHLLKECATELSETIIILPSKRASTFLIKSLANQSNKAILGPQIYSLADFIDAHSELTLVNRLDLMLELFEVHKKIEKEKADPLEDFLGWGSTLLQDFNELDRYLVDTKEIYSFLTEAKALEQWNPAGVPLSEFQQNYLSFWRKLYSYYIEFKKSLQSEHKAYSGMQFRVLAEQALEGKPIKTDAQAIYVIGFNAFSKAETSILKGLEENHQLKFLWDSDTYYMNDSSQEAGLFLREHKKHLNDFQWVFEDLETKAKEINTYGVSAQIGEAKTIAAILEENAEKLEDTALILADEGLLMPVLESLPENISEVNVTMGSSIKDSNFYDFFESLFNLLLEYEKTFKEGHSNRAQFYFSSLLRVLSHAAVSEFEKTASTLCQALAEEIRSERKMWITASRLEEINQALGIDLFPKEVKVLNCIGAINKLCSSVMESLFKNNQKVKLEYLAHFEQQFVRLYSLIEEGKPIESVEQAFLLYQQMIADEEVAFVGEPLSGLQVMGVLESRLLDFKRIIICGLNEGVLPAGKSQNSLIPYDIKRKFDLPSYKEKDAIFAYHFYRILQRAEKIDLVYNTKVDQMNGGERSRFLEQLIYELPLKNPHTKLNQYSMKSPEFKKLEIRNAIQKDADSIEKIKAHLEEGLSTSALNTYMECRQDYFYKYVLRLRVEDELSETVDARMFGNIIHSSLEELYKPMIGVKLDQNSFKQIHKQLDQKVHEAYVEETNVNTDTGSHKLSESAVKEYVKSLIKLDEDLVAEGNELIIRALEEKYNKRYPLEGIEGIESIKLIGKVDRIDELNGIKRIIDYKSGSVYPSDLKSKAIENPADANKFKVNQLLIYLALTDSLDSNTQSGIISMRNLSNGFMPLHIDSSVENKEKTYLDLLLKQVVEEMLNPEIPFSHSEDSNYCDFCLNREL